MPHPKRRAVVYVLQCSDGSLYTGASTDLSRRVRLHREGDGARYTRSRLPLQLIAWWYPRSYDTARSQEACFKGLARRTKIAILAAGQAFGHSIHKAPIYQLFTVCEEPPLSKTPPQQAELPAYADRAHDSRVRIVTDRGEIVFELFPDDAPLHCASFIKLADEGFYDGLSFHRVEPGFVVQGGDPNGDGTGGPGYRLPAEFNARPHLRGTVAMARSSQPDSAGSQFYICLDDARFLDGQYTVFGRMTGGFEALDAIRRGDVMRTVRVESVSPQRLDPTTDS
jgi:cyclophilin family peptidyl-prolyl cis-trans isomerase/predicted GIY-YIG superfamily endonuclease